METMGSKSRKKSPQKRRLIHHAGGDKGEEKRKEENDSQHILEFEGAVIRIGYIQMSLNYVRARECILFVHWWEKKKNKDIEDSDSWRAVVIHTIR